MTIITIVIIISINILTIIILIMITIMVINIIIGSAFIFYSLDWIRSFGITGKNKNFCTAHLIITTEPDMKPSMEALQERFGDEIKFYVDFVEGKASIMLSFQMNDALKSNNEVVTRVQSPPKSGDAIYIEKKESKTKTKTSSLSLSLRRSLRLLLYPIAILMAVSACLQNTQIHTGFMP